MNSTTEVQDVLAVDRGPVRDAALTLVGLSTLADHVTVTEGEYTTQLEMDGSIPFECWGSGTQALWRLLSAIAYSRCEVSLYEVAARCDQRNRAAAVRAITLLCGGA